MDKTILENAGVTEEEFAKCKESWKNSPLSKDEKYLNSPEGRLMAVIYGD